MQIIRFAHIDLFSGGDSISYGGQSCKGVNFETTVVNAKRHLTTRYGVDPEFLSIGNDQLTVIKTDCDLPGMNEFMKLHNGRLLVFIEGVFIFLEPDVIY